MDSRHNAYLKGEEGTQWGDVEQRGDSRPEWNGWDLRDFIMLLRMKHVFILTIYLFWNLPKPCLDCG